MAQQSRRIPRAITNLYVHNSIESSFPFFSISDGYFTSDLDVSDHTKRRMHVCRWFVIGMLVCIPLLRETFV